MTGSCRCIVLLAHGFAGAGGQALLRRFDQTPEEGMGPTRSG